MGPPVRSKRLPASAKHKAIDRESKPTARNAIGPHAPTLAWTCEGSRKIALPITWLTPIAVRSHFPSSRRSVGGSFCGASPTPDALMPSEVRLFPEIAHELAREPSVPLQLDPSGERQSPASESACVRRR